VNNRFVSVIEMPGRIWSDHAVIDLHRRVKICVCSLERDADEIAACMNIQHQEREAKRLAEGVTE
jgi:hypothetical protein